MEDDVVRVEVVDDLDEPITVRQLLNNYVSQGDERLDLLGGEPAVLNFQVDGGAEDLRQLLPRRWCGDLDGGTLVTTWNPDFPCANSEHKVEGADGLLVARQDVRVTDHRLIHRLLVIDQVRNLLSGYHLFAVSLDLNLFIIILLDKVLCVLNAHIVSLVTNISVLVLSCDTLTSLEEGISISLQFIPDSFKSRSIKVVDWIVSLANTGHRSQYKIEREED